MSPERRVIVDKKISDAVDELPQTTRMLAVIQYPVAARIVEEIGLQFWTEEQRHVVTVKTFNKCYVIKDEAMNYILQNSTEDEIKTAHEDSVKIFSKMIDWNDSIDLREQRLKHSIPAGLTEQAIKDAISLYERYKNQARPFAILSLLEQTDITPLDLPYESQQIFLWAYGQEQKRKYNFKKDHPEIMGS